MKKRKESDKNTVSSTQETYKYDLSQINREYSSLFQPEIYMFFNRWNIEVGKSLITPQNQAASEDIHSDTDLGSEGLLTQIAASQIGLSEFQETRFLSLKELNKRVNEALRRVEELHDELIRQEEEIEIDS